MIRSHRRWCGVWARLTLLILQEVPGESVRVLPPQDDLHTGHTFIIEILRNIFGVALKRSTQARKW